jgi:hypothetical protein
MPLPAWQLDRDGPKRLSVGGIGLEKNLESWIAAAQPPRPKQGVALDRVAIRTPGRYASEHPSHPEIGRALIDASFRPKRGNGGDP